MRIAALWPLIDPRAHYGLSANDPALRRLIFMPEEGEAFAMDGYISTDGIDVEPDRSSKIGGASHVAHIPRPPETSSTAPVM